MRVKLIKYNLDNVKISMLNSFAYQVFAKNTKKSFCVFLWSCCLN